MAVDELAFSNAQVVIQGDGAALDESIHQMTADETGAANDE
jgi:hypothetical protein